MAARQALQGVPEEATTSVDMDGETTFQTLMLSLCCNTYPAWPYRASHIRKALGTDT